MCFSYQQQLGVIIPVEHVECHVVKSNVLSFCRLKMYEWIFCLKFLTPACFPSFCSITTAEQWQMEWNELIVSGNVVLWNANVLFVRIFFHSY